jgi:hypothetical protein
MASIFTYDTAPQRVASPWSTPTDTPKPATPKPDRVVETSSPLSGQLADYGVTRLEAEPQEGPTEYKLHLLLRPRREYSSSSTGSVISGSQQQDQLSRNLSAGDERGPFHGHTKQARQQRLEGLTTQLLWRLQQSSPYHASSTSELVRPRLPEDASDVGIPMKPGNLLAGLEASRGALYEIGVSDDGTFVGLTKDEMDESLKNLEAMAASLGCKVKVEKMVIVGDCEWYDHPQKAPRRRHLFTNVLKNSEGEEIALRHQEKLWVAEALVIPDISSRRAIPSKSGSFSRCKSPSPSLQIGEERANEPAIERETTEQLRITLTGPTTSGKSSLLGTLSTATLDNGRGKSRLSLLKHRHEIASGVTSSVTQELLGYKDDEVRIPMRKLGILHCRGTSS